MADTDGRSPPRPRVIASTVHLPDSLAEPRRRTESQSGGSITSRCCLPATPADRCYIGQERVYLQRRGQVLSNLIFHLPIQSASQNAGSAGVLLSTRPPSLATAAEARGACDSRTVSRRISAHLHQRTRAVVFPLDKTEIAAVRSSKGDLRT